MLPKQIATFFSTSSKIQNSNKDVVAKNLGNVDILIIGSGPSGLYLLIKLWQMGIRSIHICDPRAGEYTRAGHLIKDVLIKSATNIREEKYSRQIEIASDSDAIHIKDFERTFYKLAMDLGIEITRDKFIRLEQDDDNHLNVRAIVTDGHKERKISAKLIVDASGERAVVINAFNQLFPKPSFHFKPFTEHPFPTHLVIYVRMNSTLLKSTLKLLDDADVIREGSSSVSDLQFFSSIASLSKWSWSAPIAPYCYGKTFGKKRDKVCFYLECPPSLREHSGSEKESKCYEWLSLVLHIYTGKDVPFERLPPSKKYSKKQRIQLFTVQANVLSPASSSNIVAVGDSGISSYYRLGNGIYNALGRIDLLCLFINVHGGKFQHFDTEGYNKMVGPLLEMHMQKTRENILVTRKSLIRAHDLAIVRLQNLISKEENSGEKERYGNLINDYRQQQLTQLIYLNKLIFSETHRELGLEYLEFFHTTLFKTDFEADRKCLELLVDVTYNLIQMGNDFFKQNRVDQAVNLYQLAVQISCALQQNKEGSLYGLQDQLTQDFMLQMKRVFQNFVNLPSYKENPEDEQPKTIRIR